MLLFDCCLLLNIGVKRRFLLPELSKLSTREERVFFVWEEIGMKLGF